jgi:hypothetical protein
MRVVPERSPWLQLATAFGGFFLGPYAALRVSRLLTPDSELVQTAGVFALVLVFVGGTLLWMGLGFATFIVRRLLGLLSGRARGRRSTGGSDRTVPPGYRSYVVLGAVLGVAVGILAGVVTDLGLLWATAVWALLGTCYGLVLSVAAHLGYLPSGEPE